MKTEDEEDSQEIRKKTLSSGSKFLFICDATSTIASLITQSNLDLQLSCTSVHADLIRILENYFLN